MTKRFTFPLREGLCSRQAHADFPKEAIYEREVGREGFYGAATHFHHRHPPTAWSDWQGELRPRLFDLNRLTKPTDESPWALPPLLSNAQCQLRWWQPNKGATPLFRNSDGDDLLFVHSGEGALFCDYGHLAFREGDYVLIPRGTNWRIDAHQPLQVLMIESTDGSYTLPERGMVGQHAVFDPAVLQVPRIDEAFKAQYSEETTSISVKRHNHVSVITYPFNPLDAVGWHGDLAVMRLNWRDIRPLTSHRYHLPPSAHTTFVGGGFVVCTFVPRPIETDPDALKVPFYHSNEDYDEVLFYHSGDFFSRDNVEPGMITFHPAGFAHGPHPKAFQNSQLASKNSPETEPTAKAQIQPELESELQAKSMTDEVAVMIDVRHALSMSEAIRSVEDDDYIHSWQQ